MTRQELIQEIKSKASYLCIGLDTDITKIPEFLLDTNNPILEFNKLIIDATKDFCVAYKLNTAFYECHGADGWNTLHETLNHIPENIFTIADGKRGDIGNTATMYAKAFFENMNFDSATVAPYMGSDAAIPFLDFKGKWVILLALTSNQGGQEIQLTKENGQFLYEKIIRAGTTWGNLDNMMFVIGATHAERMIGARKIAPDNFFLVPGFGAQGGSLKEVSKNGLNKDCGLLVSSSRAIIYASNGEDFAESASNEAQKVQQEMAEYLRSANII
ncbi:orotidine-5'-phosphate decarboxylase [Cytophagaceae bacterium AH-315-L13]|nr:orotidine-5'-phosphate decarboxylase [Cytophagaceae bacterium AH-315-L13]